MLVKRSWRQRGENPHSMDPIGLQLQRRPVLFRQAPILPTATALGCTVEWDGAGWEAGLGREYKGLLDAVFPKSYYSVRRCKYVRICVCCKTKWVSRQDVGGGSPDVTWSRSPNSAWLPASFTTRVLPFSFISQTVIASLLLAKLLSFQKYPIYLYICSYFLSKWECLPPTLTFVILFSYYFLHKIIPTNPEGSEPHPNETVQQSLYCSYYSSSYVVLSTRAHWWSSMHMAHTMAKLCPAVHYYPSYCTEVASVTL